MAASKPAFAAGKESEGSALRHIVGVAVACTFIVSCSASGPDASLGFAVDGNETASLGGIGISSVAPSLRPVEQADESVAQADDEARQDVTAEEAVAAAETEVSVETAMDDAAEPAKESLFSATSSAEQETTEKPEQAAAEVKAAEKETSPAETTRDAGKRTLLSGLFASSSDKNAASAKTDRIGLNAKATADLAAEAPEQANVADTAPEDEPAETASVTAPAASPDEKVEKAAGDAAPTQQKRSLLSAFFAPSEDKVPFPASSAASKVSAEQAEPEDEQEKPTVTLASASPANAAVLGGDSLPGVRGSDQLFDFSSKSGIQDESNLDLYEETDGSYQVASAAGLARLAPNGLIKQRESVDVACFKPELLRLLKVIERRFGKQILVTSGYRSPEYNKRVRGARKSMHMYCAAADIQIEGVGKRELATFVRALPGRGGVGTYCHTRSVHVDVGPQRDWNWNCRRRR